MSHRDLGELLSAASTPDPESVFEYLWFGDVWRSSATFFADIGRVPPGHELVGGRTRRWWSAPEPAIVEVAEPWRMVEEFWRRLGDAVERAVPPGQPVTIALSAGLDSAALAVAAIERFGAKSVRAVTMGYESDFPDPEPPLARSLAGELGIEWELVPADSTDALAAWTQRLAAPTLPTTGADVRWEQATSGTVVLWGLGGDSLLRGDRAHYSHRLRRGEWARALQDILRTTVVHGRRPPLGLQRALRRDAVPVAPSWVARPADWERIAASRAAVADGWRRGIDELGAPAWSFHFEQETARAGYPFFDVELATWVATLPTAPWCVDKEVLRAALRGRVPDTIRLRPKTPLCGIPKLRLDPNAVDVLKEAIEGADHLDGVDTRQVLTACRPGAHDYDDLTPALRAAAVAKWVQTLTPRRQVATKRA